MTTITFTDADGNIYDTGIELPNDPDFDAIPNVDLAERIADYTAPTKRYDGAITVSVISSLNTRSMERSPHEQSLHNTTPNLGISDAAERLHDSPNRA